MYPLTHGVYDNGIDLPEGIGEAGFAGQLAEQGYSTAFIGKAHFASRQTFEPSGTPGNQHFPPQYGADWLGPYMGFQHVELAVNGHDLVKPTEPPIGAHYERWYYGDGKGAFKNELRQIRLPPDVGAPMTWNSALPSAWHNATWVADQTVDWLRQNRTSPFCMWVSFSDPHPPFDCPEPWSRLHDPQDVALPSHRTLNLEQRPWWHEACMKEPTRIYKDPRMGDSKRHDGFTRLAPTSEGQLRHMLANYYGTISLVDHNVGRIIDTLHTLGLMENTIIICTSDHGFLMGDHGMLLQNPVTYEGLVRVGLVMRGPGVRADQVIDDVVSTTDLCSTMYDYCGIADERATHGQSLRSLADGREQSRDFAYLEWDVEARRYGLGKDLALRMVRTRTHKLTIDENSGEGELYDLASDSFEAENIFDDPAHAGVRRELQDMLESRPPDQLTPRLERVGYF